MQSTDWLACWVYSILAIYVVLLATVAVRRIMKGKQAASSSPVRILGGVAEVRQGADLSSLVGLFLVAASLLWTTVGLIVGYGAAQTLSRVPDGILSVPGLLLFTMVVVSLYFVAGSIWLGFGRWSVVVDGRARTVTTMCGLLVPLWRKSYRLDEFTAVVIRAGKKRAFRRARAFVIRIEGRGKPVMLDRSTCRNRDEAQEFAKQIAAAGGLAVQDHPA